MRYTLREAYLFLHLGHWKRSKFQSIYCKALSYIENGDLTNNEDDLTYILRELSPEDIPEELREACSNYSESTLIWIQRNHSRLLEGEKNLTPEDAVSYAVEFGERIPELEEKIIQGTTYFTYCREFGPIPKLEEKLIQEEKYDELLWYAAKITHRILNEEVEKNILTWCSSIWNMTSSVATILDLYMALHCKEKGRWIEFEEAILRNTPSGRSWEYSMLRSYLVALYDAPGGNANRIEWLEKFFLDKDHSLKWAPLIRTYIKVFPDPELIHQLLPLLPNDES